MARSKSTLGNSSNSRSPEEWAEKFDELMAIQRRTVFEIGEALLLAEQELNKKDFATAIKMSGLKTKTTANNYMRVAESKTLNDADVQKHLPSTVGALIDLAAWTKEDIGAAIMSGCLHPSAERERLRRWKDDRHQSTVKRQQIEDEEEKTGLKHVEYPQDAIIVGYVKADPQSWSPDKWRTIETLYSRLQAELSLNDVYFTYHLDVENSASEHRFSQISKKLIAAIKSLSTLRNDPYFSQYWKTALQAKGSDGSWSGSEFVEDRDAAVIEKRFEAFKSAARIWDAERQCRAIKVVDETKILKEIRSIALHISSADFAEVHKSLKFSVEDWNSLGVTNPGSPTITRFLKKESNKVSKKVATAKRKTNTQ